VALGELIVPREKREIEKGKMKNVAANSTGSPEARSVM
jgi:hypothetical protein